MRKTFMLLAIFLLFPAALTFGADESMVNPVPSWRGSGRGKIFVPGARIALPDGRRGFIQTILPNGQLQTDLGVVLNPDGTLVEEPGVAVEVLETPETAVSPGKPEAPATSAEPEKAVEPPTPRVAVPEAVVPEVAVKPETPQSESEKPLSLAEMIPLTPVQEKKAPQEQKPQAKPEQPRQEKKPQEQKPQAKPEKKEQPKQEKPAPKAKTGEELRIPEEAIKTGNLDFLEGCWQGTRPEYYSKRTIKECFCFGAHGKNGKRRVIDQLGGRSCIGATSARLSGNGILSVTSQGAACDDGERWGQAEMQCRNTGQRTPCSWVFRDANNGRQSYTIPFVKVDSCGR